MLDRHDLDRLRSLTYEIRVDGIWQVWRTGERKITDPEELKTARAVLGITDTQRRLL